MPNWCFTVYSLVGSDEDAKAAYDALRKLELTERTGNFETGSFLSNPRWLGYVVEDILGKSWEDVQCRGTFESLELTKWGDKSIVEFNTETAWGPCDDLVELLADKYNLSLNYFAQEPGNVLYCRASPDKIYHLTLHYSSDEDEENFESLADFLCEYGDKYGLTSDATLEEAIAAVNATDVLVEITDQTSLIKDTGR